MSAQPQDVPADIAIATARTAVATKQFPEHFRQTRVLRFEAGHTIPPTVPVRVVWGAKDRVALARRSRFTDELPRHARVDTWNACGQMVVWDQPTSRPKPRWPRADVRPGPRLLCVRAKLSGAVALDSLTDRGDDGGAGMRVGELVGEQTQLVERAVVVVDRPGGAEASAHEWLIALGQVREDVALLRRTQRWTGVWTPSTSRIALRSAFAPSSTTSTPCSTSRPRSARFVSSVVATVASSVEPCPSPSGA